VSPTATETEPATTIATQPHDQSKESSTGVRCAASMSWGVRHLLPAERPSLTHHFTIGQHDGYMTVGLFPNGEPGEIFVSIAKEGSTLGGLMDSFAKAVSIGLQYGVPLELLCAKFSHTRFEPSGWTGNAELGFANSITDYIFRWLHLRFVERLASSSVSLTALAAAIYREVDGPTGNGQAMNGHDAVDALSSVVEMGDASTCNVCGANLGA
jgi:ribonucleoside-diphosphate reductase alpha chain